MTEPIAIVLNGASSAGKTSMARAIQRSSATPVLHASLDAFTDMFDWPSVSGDAVRNECHAAGVANFHAALGILASGRFPIVVDHVFEQRSWFDACLAALAKSRVFLVGVRCPLAVIEERERARGDRRIGLGRWQADRVHEGRNYDLELDTSLLTPGQCAQRILARVGLDPIAGPSAESPSAAGPPARLSETAHPMDSRGMITVQALGPVDAEPFRALRLKGLRESPSAFGASYHQEAALSLPEFSRRLEASAERWVLGARIDGALVGVIGFGRDLGEKLRHRGVIWGLYVDPGSRGKGVGRALVESALARVDRLPGLRSVRLSVTAANSDALHLYESAGFVRFGVEDGHLFVGGAYHSMVLMSRPTAPQPQPSGGGGGPAGPDPNRGGRSDAP